MPRKIDEQTRKKIIAIVHALQPGIKIYLFGSRARGTHGERSDIDLALDAGHALRPSHVGEVRDMLNASNMPFMFDVVDMRSVSQEMHHLIKTEGIEWKA